GRTAAPIGAFARLFTQGAYACGIRADGSHACWGADGYGETSLGAGALAQVAAGRNHSCALAALGEARCVGSNLYGQAPVFTIAGDGLGNAIRGQAFPPATLSMVVANPED